MLVASLQVVLSVVGAALLFLAVRRFQRVSRGIFLLVAAGFLVRAFAGQAIFWISYLGLPFGRSLQAGHGFWFFALDATGYFAEAIKLVAGGPDAILAINRGLPSPFFIQLLASFLLAFGTSPAVGLLINLGAFLGICALIVWLAPGEQTHLRAIAIAGVALTPSAVLWALQPLKDTFFALLIVAFVAGAVIWERVHVKADWKGALLCTGLLTAVVYAIAGIRWYFVPIAAVAFVPTVLLTIVRSPRRRMSIASTMVMVPLAATAFIFGAGPYVPEPVRRVVTLQVLREPEGSVTSVVQILEQTRTGFERTAAGTQIGSGSALRKLEGTQDNRKVTAVRPASTDDSQKVVFSSMASSAAVVPVTGAPAASGASAHASEPVAAPASISETPRVAMPTASIATPTAAPAESMQSVPLSTAMSPAEVGRVATSEQAPASAAVTASPAASPTPVTEAPPAGPVPVAQVSTVPENGDALPGAGEVTTTAPVQQRTRLGRLLAGLAAFALPRTVAEAAGILEISGGRGLWLFVEIDTIVFDLLVLVAVWMVWKTIRMGNPPPVAAAMVAIMTLLAAAALIYTVSNFGTLFRHRQMILMGVVLLPLALASTSQRLWGRNGDSEPVA